jgi:hypothetical protein
MYRLSNDETLFESDKEASLKSLQMSIGRGAFFRVIESDGVIRGWILARIVRREFLKDLSLQQHFCCVSFKGIRAVRAVIKLHAALIEEAYIKNIRYVESSGSHMDTKNTFVRILEREGWERRGYLAVLDLQR